MYFLKHYFGIVFFEIIKMYSVYINLNKYFEIKFEKDPQNKQ